MDRREFEVYPSPIPHRIPHHSCRCIGIASSAFVNNVLDKHNMIHTKKQSDSYVKPAWFVCKNKLCRASVPFVPSVGTLCSRVGNFLFPVRKRSVPTNGTLCYVGTQFSNDCSLLFLKSSVGWARGVSRVGDGQGEGWVRDKSEKPPYPSPLEKLIIF